MTTFVKGQTVRIKAIVPQGPVAKMRMDDDGKIEYLVEWTTTDGVTQERWFTEEQLESAE
jgi:hypothetical protein